MRRFAHAAAFAVALSAPAITGALADHPAVSVLGAPGGCSSNCSVGGSTLGAPGQGSISSGGAAQGGHFVVTTSTGVSESESGTNPNTFATQRTGHTVITGTATNDSTTSGNFTTLPGRGHCTGVITC
jgi:hypothetical protein